MREHWKLVATTSGARVASIVTTMLAAVITARWLGPEGRGTFVAAVAWVTLFATFAHLSLGRVVIFLGAGRPKEAWLPATLGSLGLILAVATIVAFAVAWTMFASSGGALFRHVPAFTLVLALLALPALIVEDAGGSVLSAIGRLSLLNSSQLAGSVAAIALTFVVIAVLRLGASAAVAAFSVAHALIATLIVIHLLRAGRPVSTDRTIIRSLLSGGARLHLNAVGAFLFAQANVLIVNHFRPAQETAWFQLAQQIVTAMQAIPMAASSVTYSLVSLQGPDGAWPQQRRIALGIVVLMVVLGAALWLVAPWIVPLIFGSAFAPATPMLRILLLSVLGMTMSNVMASQWIGRGLFLQASLITFAIGLLSVAGNLLFVPRLGMSGAAWTAVGTSVLAIVINAGMALWIDLRKRNAGLV